MQTPIWLTTHVPNHNVYLCWLVLNLVLQMVKNNQKVMLSPQIGTSGDAKCVEWLQTCCPHTYPNHKPNNLPSKSTSNMQLHWYLERIWMLGNILQWNSSHCMIVKTQKLNCICLLQWGISVYAWHYPNQRQFGLLRREWVDRKRRAYHFLSLFMHYFKFQNESVVLI